MSTDYDANAVSDRPQPHLTDLLLSLVPADGATIGNTALRRLIELRFTAEGRSITDEAYWQAQAELIAQGLLLKGQGRGGTVRWTSPAAALVSRQWSVIRGLTMALRFRPKSPRPLPPCRTRSNQSVSRQHPSRRAARRPTRRPRSYLTDTWTSARTIRRSGWSHRPPTRRPVRPAGPTTPTSTPRSPSIPSAPASRH